MNLFSHEDILSSNQKDQEAGLTLEEIFQIQAYHVHYISQLARVMKVRQRVVATAAVYFRRFYLRSSFEEHDPRLVAPACLFLAAKAEESAVQARHLEQAAKKCREEVEFLFNVRALLDMELVVLEASAFGLAVYHPYRALQSLLDDAELADSFQVCWGLVNDSYLSELCLTHPPHMVGVAAVYATGALQNKEKEMDCWVKTLNLDSKELNVVVAQVLAVYDRDSMIGTVECNRLLNQVHIGSSSRQYR